MVAQIQMQVPLGDIRFAFKFRENAPYRYYDVDTLEFSEPGYLAQIFNILAPDAEFSILREQGYNIMLDGTVDILVLDMERCPISDAGALLKKIALRMN